MEAGKFLIKTHLLVQCSAEGMLVHHTPGQTLSALQESSMAERVSLLQCPRKGQIFTCLPVPLPRSGAAAPGLSQLGFEPLLIRVGCVRVHFAYLIDKCTHKVNETHLKLWKLSSFPSVHHWLWEDTNSP